MIAFEQKARHNILVKSQLINRALFNFLPLATILLNITSLPPRVNLRSMIYIQHNCFIFPAHVISLCEPQNTIVIRCELSAISLIAEFLARFFDSSLAVFCPGCKGYVPIPVLHLFFSRESLRGSICIDYLIVWDPVPVFRIVADLVHKLGKSSLEHKSLQTGSNYLVCRRSCGWVFVIFIPKRKVDLVRSA